MRNEVGFDSTANLRGMQMGWDWIGLGHSLQRAPDPENWDKGPVMGVA